MSITRYTRSKKITSSKSNSGRVILSTLIIVSIISLSFLYITQANGVIGQGYDIRKLENQLQELQTANQKLQIEAARLQFPANLEEIAQEYNMVKVEKVTYLKGHAGMAAIDTFSSN